MSCIRERRASRREGLPPARAVMRILANENFPLAAVNALRQDGHDVLWVRTESPGISDRDVLSRAQLDARVVVTFDKDFGELAFRYGYLQSAGSSCSGSQCHRRRG